MNDVCEQGTHFCFPLDDPEDEDSWVADIMSDPDYHEISVAITTSRGREVGDEVNSNVLPQLWKSKIKNWKILSDKLIDELIGAINRAIGLIFEQCCADEEFQAKTKGWLIESQAVAASAAREELERLVSDERNGKLWTLNPQRNTMLDSRRNDRIAHMVNELVGDDQPPLGQSADADAERLSVQNMKDSSEKRIRAWLAKKKDVTSVLDTYDRVAAYHDVACDKFIDNIGNQVVERHLLGPKSPLSLFDSNYVYGKLNDNNELLKRLAGENVEKVAQREMLESKRRSLEMALKKASEFEYSAHD